MLATKRVGLGAMAQVDGLDATVRSETLDGHFVLDQTLELMPEIIWNLLELLPTAAWACSCQDSMLRYKQRKMIDDDFHNWI